MFKNFHGFSLVHALHAETVRMRSTFSHRVGVAIKLLLVAAVTITLWFLPADTFGIEGLTVVEHRLIAIFAFAALMWVLEAVPAWTTSLAVILLILFTISNHSLLFLRDGVEGLGTLVSSKSILNCFADPIIILFIGGFILAISATKSGLDLFLARVMLKPFGTRSEFVLLGFILVTAVFSMFLSNTATAAMMLTFLAPVLKALPADGKGKIGLALSIPFAANIGGIATPIGTPPNAIILKYLNDPEGLNMNIGFGQWTALMLPFTIILLFIVWLVIVKVFPFKQKKIVLDIKGETRHDAKAIITYVTFAITIILWMLDRVTGVDANTVAMFPIAVLCLTGVIQRTDLEEISWSVLWMVAGGFALGEALNSTGLAQHMVDSIPFNTWSPVLMIIGSGLIVWIIANFISHTATATLLAPILAVVGTSMQNELLPVGGVATLMVGVALGCSLAMVLPISTPPNALAHATGLIKQKDMEKMGIIIGIIGLILGYSILIFCGKMGLL